MAVGTGVAEQFTAAMDAVTGRSRVEHSALLPNKLAWACVRVLRVSAASISVATDPDLRVPLGASSDAASVAESLQYTTGTGPCLAAHASGTQVWAPEAVLARRWPVYHRHLVHRTPFRAVHALPLRGELAGIGSLDLYFRSDEALVRHNARDAEEVADQVAAALLADPAARGPSEPIWLSSPPARSRTAMAMAVGMVVITVDVGPEDALALLRAHAGHGGTTVDEVAHRLLDRSLSPEDLLPPGAAPLRPVQPGPIHLPTQDVHPV